MSSPQRKKRPLAEAPFSDDSDATKDTNVARQWRYRHVASWRLPCLEHIGRSDPWHYEPPTAKYEEAAEHLLELGLTPAPNREALQAMRRRGGRSLRTANLIAERWDGAA